MLTRIGNAQNRVLDAGAVRISDSTGCSTGTALAKNPKDVVLAHRDARRVCSGRVVGARERRAKIDPYRRSLQNNYLTTMNGKLNPPARSSRRLRQLAALGIRISRSRRMRGRELRGEVMSLRGEIRGAIRTRRAIVRPRCICRRRIIGSGRFSTRSGSRYHPERSPVIPSVPPHPERSPGIARFPRHPERSPVIYFSASIAPATSSA